MAITGGIKFLERSYALANEGATAVASSGTVSAVRALDRNPFTVWRTQGSNDAINESLTVTFAEEKTIDRIFVLGHNFKSYSIRYDNAGSPTDFTSVIGLNGAAKTGINETNYALDASYYEFAPVTTNEIIVECDETQIANQEKKLSTFVATEELFTLDGYPIVNNLTASRNQQTRRTLSGRTYVANSFQTFSFTLELKDYPGSYPEDFTNLVSLYDREESFNVYLCGGREGSTFFRTPIQGFRAKDLFEMRVVGDAPNTYSANVYTGQTNLNLRFEESL